MKKSPQKESYQDLKSGLLHQALRTKRMKLENLSHQDWSSANLEGLNFQTNLTEKMILKSANLRNIKAHAASFTTVDFSKADLRGASDVTGALFHGCSMKNVNFAGANLAGTLFFQCELTGSDFSGALLSGAVFNECRLEDTRWTSANLHAGYFLACALEGADFSAAHLDSARFFNCEGKRILFSRAVLAQSQFSGVSFPSSNFWGAQAEDMMILNSKLQSCSFSNGKRAGFQARSLIVRNSSLEGSSFSGAYLYRTQMTGDLFSRMSLRRVDFSRSTLINALFAADLRRAKFSGSMLDYAHFVQCDARGAQFHKVNMRGATLVKGHYSQNLFSPTEGPAHIDRSAGLLQEDNS